MWCQDHVTPLYWYGGGASGFRKSQHLTERRVSTKYPSPLLGSCLLLSDITFYFKDGRNLQLQGFDNSLFLKLRRRTNGFNIVQHC